MSRYEFPAAGIPLSAALLLVPAILFYGSSFVRKTRLFDSLQRPYSEVMLILQQLRPRNRTEYKNALTLFLLITVCIAASRAFTVLEPLILRTIVDKLSMRQQSMPWKLITTFVILSPLRDGFWYAQWALALRLETTVHAQITTAVYDKLMDLPASYHDNKSTITEWQTICDSANSISRLVRQLVLEAIPTVLDLAVAVIAFSHVCGLRLAFVLVCVLGTWLLVLVKTTERDEQGNKEWLETWETKDALASNALSNWWTAHLFGRTECEKEEHRKAVQRIKDVDIKITDTQWLNYNSKHMALSSGLLILCLLVGNDIWKSPDSSAGDLVMFLAIWKEVVGSVQQISEWTVRPNKISKYAKEALAILRPEHNYGDRQSAKDFNFKKGNIKFSNVTFSYDETCPGGTALQDISFEVEGGKMVAIVGRSGGGKSTLLKLLTRSYEPQSGSISVDGQDIQDVRRASLVRHMSIASPNVGVLNKSVLENLRYAKPGASVQECEDVCKAACLHQKITKSFDKGYDEAIGRYKFSNGEAQRLAIARVLLRDSQIVLLDEATSNLDSETEYKIQKHLREWCAGRTVVVITHRLATIASADTILAVKDGRIVEQGPLAELLANKGYFYELWDRQRSGFLANSQAVESDSDEEARAKAAARYTKPTSRKSLS